VSGADDRTVRVWSDPLRGAEPPAVIDVFDGPIEALALVGADGRFVATLGDEPVLSIWPLDVPRDEARARAFLSDLVRDRAGTPVEDR